MSELAPWAAVVALVLSVCMVALTGTAIWLAVRWMRHKENPWPDRPDEGPRPVTAREFVEGGGVEDLNDWSKAAFREEKLEEGWSPEEIDRYFDEREPIDLT